MIRKIKRADAIVQYPCLPTMVYNKIAQEYDLHFPKTVATYTLTVAAKTHKAQIKLLSAAITKLITEMGFDHAIFLGDLSCRWLQNDGNTKAGAGAVEFLKENKIGKNFSGALLVNTASLPVFAEQLCQLIRTNTITPTIYFTDPAQHFVANICQYGNLHISLTGKKADRLFCQVVKRTPLEFFTGTCYNKFSKSAAIAGRHINV